MVQASLAPTSALNRPDVVPAKFRDPAVTATGAPRASVSLAALKTLWVNTGSLCNIECAGCYIESGPTNDRLSYITRAEVARYLDEITVTALPVEEIGFTGGEPFMNKDLIAMTGDALARGLRVLILTNAMKPLWHHRDDLAALRTRHGSALALRVSIDHFTQIKHEAIRGTATWSPMIQGLRWLAEHGFNLSIASRLAWGKTEAETRAGFASLFKEIGLMLDAEASSDLILFPDMDATRDVPEITEACWDILDVNPADMMCASSRMVVKRKGAAVPVVVPCTLLPYDPAFEMGETLSDAETSVSLNHPHCATFCVLGGASCSGGA